MFTLNLAKTLAVATLGIATLAGATTLANAHDVRGHVGYSHKHGQFELRFGHQPRVIKRAPRHHGTCRPGRAVRKAERHGLRKVRVQRVNHRVVVVKGRKRGGQVRVAFHRDSPRCNVAWVKRGFGHGRHGGYRW